MKTIILLTALCPLLICGCSTYHAPVDVGAESPYGVSTGVAALAGGAGGAALGNSMGGSMGAVAGGVAGATVVGGGYALLQSADQKAKQEAYQAGLIDGREAALEWVDDGYDILDPSQTIRKGPKMSEITLPSGDYESVPYLRRSYKCMVTPGT